MTGLIAEFRTRFVVPPPPTDGSPNVEEMEQVLAMGHGLVEMNLAYFRRYPDTPCCLGCAGVRYVDPEPCESLCQYADAASYILRSGEVTCLGAAPYVMAKKILEGKPVELFLAPLVRSMAGQEIVIPHHYHLLIQTPEGLYDPTAKLEVGACDADLCSAAPTRGAVG